MKYILLLFLVLNINLYSWVAFDQYDVGSLIGSWDADAGDVNNDGLIDIVACGDSEVKLFKNRGDYYEEVTLVTDFGMPRGVRIGDLDNDGDLDVVACSIEQGRILWWENNGFGDYEQHTIDDNFEAAHTVYIGDINGDGINDVTCCQFGGDGEVAWWAGSETGNFGEKVSITTVFTQSTFIDGKDIDNNGDIDLVACCENSSLIYYYLNDGSGNFSEHLIDDVFYKPHTLFWRDFDFDGDYDIVGCSCHGSKVAWWENDGNNNFEYHFIGNVAYTLWADIADFDDDGDYDVVSGGSGGVFILENQDFDFSTRHWVSSQLTQVFCSRPFDINGDGKLDVIVAPRSNNKISILENQGLTSIGDESPASKELNLLGNYPNPFNSTTTIGFYLEKSGNVQIAVYDSNGASVYQYEGENFDKGEHWIEFKADKLCSGIYYYEINVSNTHKKGKMVYLK